MRENGNRSDNRIENLRKVTTQENRKNAALYTNNTSGVTGVYFNRRLNKWCAQIKHNGKTHHLGSFKKFEKAVEARKIEENKLGFHKNHGKRKMNYVSRNVKKK